MEADKRDLETYIEQERLSVQRRVPIEIWQEVFTLVCCLSSDEGCSLMITENWRGDSFEVVAVPITLGQVCSLWRNIITTSPKLWASICVDLSRGFPIVGTKLVDTFLTKSGSCPLHLQVAVGDDWSKSVRNAWTLLASHISRSQRLFLNFQYVSDRTVRRMFQHHNVTFDDLAFYSSFTHPPENDDGELALDSPFWKALSEAPKLSGVLLDFTYPLGSLPYHQLTAMHIQSLGTDIEGFLSILKVTAKLGTLTIGQFTGKHDAPHPVPRRVELPALHTLSLCDYEEEDFYPVAIQKPSLKLLLTSLILPSLSTFELACFSHSKDTEVWPSFLLDMLGSSTTLRHLSLCIVPLSRMSYMGVRPDDYLSWEPLSVFLRTIPHITHLHLKNSCRLCWDNFLSPSLAELTDMSRNGTAILPHLTHVSLTDTNAVDAMSTVLALATARSPPRLAELTNDDFENVCPLEELRVEDTYSSEIVLEPQALEVIRALKQDGVRVVITRPYWW